MWPSKRGRGLGYDFSRKPLTGPYPNSPILLGGGEGEAEGREI